MTIRSDTDTILAIRFQDGTRTGSVVVTKEISLKESLPPTDAALSNYELFNRVVTITPEGVHLLGSNKTLLAEMQQLNLKVVLVPLSKDTKAYRFITARGLRGFEFSSAKITSTFLFTPNDTEYMVGFSNATQEEISSVLQSIQIN